MRKTNFRCLTTLLFGLSLGLALAADPKPAEEPAVKKCQLWQHQKVHSLQNRGRMRQERRHLARQNCGGG